MQLVHNVWDIIYIKRSQENMVELEFFMQLFKILFDPYTSVNPQVVLIKELRKIMMIIFQQAELQSCDILGSRFANEKEVEHFFRKTV